MIRAPGKDHPGLQRLEKKFYASVLRRDISAVSGKARSRRRTKWGCCTKPPRACGEEQAGAPRIKTRSNFSDVHVGRGASPRWGKNSSTRASGGIVREGSGALVLLMTNPKARPVPLEPEKAFLRHNPNMPEESMRLIRQNSGLIAEQSSWPSPPSRDTDDRTVGG